MDPLIIISFIFIFGVAGVLIYQLTQNKKAGSQELTNSLLLLKQELADIKRISSEQRQELYQLQTESRKELTQSLHHMHEQV